MQGINDFANLAVGRPYEQYRRLQQSPGSYASRIGWQEKSYELPNGNRMYVDPMKPQCTVYWEVNKVGTIVGYKAEGIQCD